VVMDRKPRVLGIHGNRTRQTALALPTATMLIGVSLVAQAQTASDTSVRSDSLDQLQEIVVTATKRSENLKEVPISISVLSGQQLRDEHITSLDDLSRSVPDLAGSAGGFGASPGQGNYEIRGVSGTGGFTSIGQSTVGVYLDDVSMTVPTGAGGGRHGAEIL
jgi:iron complex outermembrane receptor protein